MDTYCQTSRKTEARKAGLSVLSFLGVIRFYRFFLSPWLGNQCRFEPSCSHYAETALIQHGAFKGIYLTVLRIFRCNPWHKGGFDPVPPPNTHFSSHSD